MAGNLEPRPARATARPSPSGGNAGALVVAGAAVLGIVLARVIDWRSHAHPR